ncbi:metallophosphoesterase [Polyangium fumosum]|uniref:ATP-grasp domain-containing protein n=1 Tax=Polyangium fumosum TaxID=889272 RepID=A0A4U1IUP5_9BACT|nr:metallophosphoesterase [Polyangium fumosum]TKC98164.1 ATP-grasp domain-containing protein [Polyangium fumosum]
MKTFTWLHLTDLHMGMVDQDWLLPNVKEQLFRDIQALEASLGPVDVVFFTGDLTQRGARSEFSKFHDFIEELWSILQNKDAKLLAVPGNHDLQRPGPTSDVDLMVQGWSDPATLPADFWKRDSLARQLVNSIFAEYNDWWRNCPRRPHIRQGLMAGDFSASLEKDGLRIGVIGLNVTFLQIQGGNYEGKLAVHPHQFHAVCGGDGPKWTSTHDAAILLTHQPPQWLYKDAAQLFSSEIQGNDRFAVHLCGHMHEHCFTQIAINRTEPAVRWQGLSTCGLERYQVIHDPAEPTPVSMVDRQHGYSIGRLEFGEQVVLKFWPRRLVPRGEFDWDTTIRRVEPSNHTSPLILKPRKRTAASYTLRAILDDVAQRANRIELRAHSSPGGTVLMTEPADLVTLIASVLRMADYTSKSTSVLESSAAFWASDMGRIVLQASQRAQGQTSLQRLFIGNARSDQAKAVAEEQREAGIDLRFLDPVAYEQAVRLHLRTLINELKQLDLTEVDLDAAEQEPLRLAFAVYGKPPRRFLGFDFPLRNGAGTAFGFVFEPTRELLATADRVLAECFAKAHNLSTDEERAQRGLVLFGAHRWKRGRVIREAIAAELDVVLAHCTGDQDMVSPAFKSIVHDVVEVEEPDNPAFLKKLGQDLTKRFPHGWHALGLDDYVCRQAALLAESGFRYYPPSADEITRQKHRLRAMWNAYCTQKKRLPLHPVPFEYREYHSFNAQGTPRKLEELTPLTGPCIVKPDELSASIEIKRAATPDHIDGRVSECLAHLAENWRQEASRHGIDVRPHIQIEAEIPRARHLNGHADAEFSVEVLSEGQRHHIVAITQKWVSQDYVELGHVVPAASFPDDLKDALHTSVTELLNQLDVFCAISHWEFIVTTNHRLALVEAQLRPGGDQIMDLIERAYGVSAERALFRWMTGRGFAFPTKNRCVAAICYLKPAVPITSYRRIEDGGNLGADLSVMENELREAVAHGPWAGPTNWTDRFVSLIRTGHSLEEARTACMRAAREVSLITDDGPVHMEVAG